MKKYFMSIGKILMSVALITAIGSYSVNGQIEIKKEEPRFIVGTLKTAGTLQAQLFYQIIGNDTLYTLLYRNQEYKQLIEYETVVFNGADGTVEKLYNILKSVFTEENKKNKDYKVNFMLGYSDVTIINFRIMGTASAMLMATGHVILSEKQIDKLFGKS